MQIAEIDFLYCLSIIVPAIHILGFFSALYAVWYTRTSQGATAWAIALISFPYLALPLYWILGRSHFQGYVSARRTEDQQLRDIVALNNTQAAQFRFKPKDEWTQGFAVIEKLSKTCFTSGNALKLLIDGDVTFQEIFTAIDQAKNYILIQFFIVHDDELGLDLQKRLLAKAAQGVRIYFLYDEIGSKSTTRGYWQTYRDAGIAAAPFNTTQGGIRNRFQINFRNHRKIVVIDGHTALVGGHNVGDEYLGKDAKFGHWRDTHLSFQGPIVQTVQLSFLEDWNWATSQIIDLDWQLNPAKSGDVPALAVATGPADPHETCGLLFAHFIHTATKRIWIASPYFVPDEQIMTALELAALRGVDVRILLPAMADHLLVYLASFSYLARSEKLGVKFYRYKMGFLHQKVVLVDERGVSIGTANLDNRSFRLNFEISIISVDKGFADQVSTMLQHDFAESQLTNSNELAEKPFLFRLGVKIARLFAPIL